MNSEELLSGLNEGQRAAVEYCDGAQLVIAGAGSGKTRVLTYKIAYLIESGMEPWRILALTFTNKAANEMKQRIGLLVGPEKARYINMGTFHSVFSRILRLEAEKIGFNNNFTIYDQTDSRSLVKAIIKEMGLDDKKYKPASVADRISRAKNNKVNAQAYALDARYKQRDNDNGTPMIAEIYSRYNQRCLQANAMDFDDLLLNFYFLLSNDEETRHKYSERFEYVLVDEYQDTNTVQQDIVLLLTAERQRVCVVGDDAQSIYSFRGANIDNILDFGKHFDNSKLFKLEQNYRSTQTIVQAANSLIAHNKRQIPKEVFSKKEEGEKILLKMAYSDQEEALVVTNEIQRIKRRDKCEYSDFAILYRTNAQSRSFEEQLRKQNIPYRIFGGMSFYQRKEIKDILAYFRLVANPNDEEALKRVINYPTRGIGATTLAKIVDAANNNRQSLWNVMRKAEDKGFTKATAAKLKAFQALVDSWTERLLTEDAYTLGSSIIRESGIQKDIYAKSSPEDVARQENVEELLAAIKGFVESQHEEGMGNHVNLVDFLQEVSLMSDIESDNDDNLPKVSLMTIHSAKGLEFPVVFVVGLEENIFPSPMSADSIRGIEEERRLLYVAITRAERHLMLTCAENRFRYGRMESDQPSRFIRDISSNFLKIEGRGAATFGMLETSSARTRSFNKNSHFGHNPSQMPNKPRWEQNPNPVASQFMADRKLRLVPPRKEEPAVNPFVNKVDFGPSLLHPGQTIEHQRFGIGKVLAVEGRGENAKATVESQNAGTKQLLLKFAKYKVL